MAAKAQDKSLKPHDPQKGVVIHVDLEDLSRKAARYGAGHVIGETLLNLCLLANDHFARLRTNGTLPRQKEPKEARV